MDAVSAVLVPVWPDACKALGIGRTTAFQLIRDGQLESVLVGRRRLVPVQALSEFAERLRDEARSPAA